MNHHAPLRHAECGASAPAITPARRGLTLIELLVTIVIMVTVLAGALPLLSPNNNSRKIREASRQLTTLFAQAQAQAARDGRPVGVAFRESGAPGSYSGVALEAYMVAEPPPFTGFSEYSRVSVQLVEKIAYGPESTNNPIGNGGMLFQKKYDGWPLWSLLFTLYGQEDPIPPRMIRIGDVLNVNGNYFMIVDDQEDAEEPNAVDPDTGYLVPSNEVVAIWLNRNGQQLAQGAQKSFSFYRQPIATSEPPLQFPRGIGIDLECSGPGGDASMWPDDKFDNLVGVPDVVKVMFSPSGGLEKVYLNNAPLEGVEQVYFLLGLFENGNGSGLERTDYDFGDNPAVNAADLAARRSRVNWLNPDSRWVTINRAGRIITTDNNVSYDPGSSLFLDPIRNANNFLAAQRDKQIGTARQSASRMDASTGR